MKPQDHEKKILEVIEKGLPSITLTEAGYIFNEKFINEKAFIENLGFKLVPIIKEMYGFDISEIRTELTFDFKKDGYYNIRPDLWINTKQDETIVIECKNPYHTKQETFGGITQIMSYKMMFDKLTNHRPKYILATSYFNMYLIEFLYYFRIDFIDFIINKEDKIAFWNNDIVI
jgi:hypothetical protein